MQQPRSGSRTWRYDSLQEQPVSREFTPWTESGKAFSRESSSWTPSKRKQRNKISFDDGSVNGNGESSMPLMPAASGANGQEPFFKDAPGSNGHASNGLAAWLQKEDELRRSASSVSSVRSVAPVRERAETLPMPSAGPGEVAPQDNGFREESQPIEVCVAAKFSSTMLKQEEIGDIALERKTIYGAAMALPQIARSASWAHTYLGLTVRTYVFLAVNLFLQVFLLSKVGLEEVLLWPFQRRMHLCSYASAMPQCAVQTPHGPDCRGPGGTDFQNLGRLYDYETWKLRIFFRDNLKMLYPERSSEIDQVADPGEYGVEDDACRTVCVLLFMMVLMDDLGSTLAMIRLLYYVPSEAGSWISYEVPDLQMSDLPDWVSVDDVFSNGRYDQKELAKRVFRKSELDFVRFKVAGMPWYWKVINFILLVVPKTFIWASLSTIGVANLMETAGIMDLVVNAMAFTFIIKIDEMAFSRLTCIATKHIMGSLQLVNFAAPEKETHDEAWKRHSDSNCWRRMWLYFPRRLAGLLVAQAAFMSFYYRTNCEQDEDGSWISQAIHLPGDLNPNLFALLFGMTTSAEGEPVWTMPNAG
jgi:hypothetical protein